jgi:hypothetical protein
VSPDEATDVVNVLGAAFGAGDLDAALATFATGCEVMYVGSEPGEHAIGRAALRALLGDLFARDERYLWRCESVHVSHSPRDVAVLADTRLYVLPAGGGVPTAHVPYRVGGVLVPEQSGWRWRYCQGSEPTTA